MKSVAFLQGVRTSTLTAVPQSDARYTCGYRSHQHSRYMLFFDKRKKIVLLKCH